jgi:hypothetical protein
MRNNHKISSSYLDDFPPLILGKGNTEESILQSTWPEVAHLRRDIWWTAARFYPQFSGFFSDVYPEDITPSFNTSQISPEWSELLRVGHFITHDLFPQDAHQTLVEHLRNPRWSSPIALDTSLDPLFRQWQNIQLPVDMVNNFNKVIYEPLISPLFGTQNALSPKDSIHCVFLKTSSYLYPKDLYTGTGLFHCDRFLPLMSTIYFPFGCNWSPFERFSGSPVFCPSRASTLFEQYASIPGWISSGSIYQTYLPPNSAITSFHHIHHRRGPYQGPGTRCTMHFTFYNKFDVRVMLDSLNNGLASDNRLLIKKELEALRERYNSIIKKSVSRTIHELLENELSVVMNAFAFILR